MWSLGRFNAAETAELLILPYKSYPKQTLNRGEFTKAPFGFSELGSLGLRFYIIYTIKAKRLSVTASGRIHILYYAPYRWQINRKWIESQRA